MSLDLVNTIDIVKEGTKEVAETAQKKTSEFHENYVSKVLPDCGKYGDAAQFAAEMIPGVSEYNAIREGDWQGFAIAAGIDVVSVAVGTVTLGTGYAAVKGSSVVAKAGAKKAVKEVAEAGTKKAVKEAAEAGVKKMAKEVAEAGTEKAVKEAAEAGAEKAAKEAAETGAKKVAKEVTETGVEKVTREVDEAVQIVKNKIDGTVREERVLEKLKMKYGDNNIIREALIRDSSGVPIKDLLTNEARRLDFVVIEGKKVIQSIEVTSETASKTAQMAKEARILEQAKKMGGAFIKHPVTGELIELGESIVTEIVRL